MYTSIVTICEFVVIFMYLTRNCTVYVNKIYVLFCSAGSWGSGYLQVNELYTRKLESLPAAYTQHKQSYISLIMSKITMFQRNILAVSALIIIF